MERERLTELKIEGMSLRDISEKLGRFLITLSR